MGKKPKKKPIDKEIVKRQIKEWEELTITDNFMFSKVMLNEKICRKMVSLILGVKLENIKEITYEEVINPGKNKGVRLDVMVIDDENRIIDFEMQVTNQHNLPKRGRYYLAAIDVSAIGLQAGESYSKLRDCYIVFICPFDYLGADLPRYTMKTICVETGEVYDDGVTKIVLNSKAASKEPDPDLKGFLDLMNNEETENEFASEIRKEISQVKDNVKWRSEYMVLKAHEMDMREEGRAEGLEEGIEIGKKEGQVSTLIDLVKDGLLSVADAAKKLNVSPEKFRSMML